ncbi:MAG TPA: aldolase/citrate lyase family protein [Terriglobia bacterium]|nr:aldolase/citrate lyase family protein [Terriglobia bacterium]
MQRHKGTALDTIRLKQTLREGRVAAGTWVFEFNTPGIARLLASTGVDFVVYDMEHSGFGIDTVRSLVAQSRGLDLTVLVRPPAGEYHLIAPVLDLGAGGVIVPKVETVSDAIKVVRACRYYPDGRRGAAFSIAHDDFQPGEIAAKIKTANDAVVCGLLIETATGVKNIDAILNVPGIDLIWVGFLDLSLSLGIPGQFTHPGFEAAISCILQAGESHGTPVGILADTPGAAIERVQQGFRCISYSGDLWLLQRALSEGIQAIRLGLERHKDSKTAAPTG